jgi:meiotically up-regulated gene 157 (Mug157) protein
VSKHESCPESANSFALQRRGLRHHAVATTEVGTIWAYEVDSNIPSLMALPYLNSSPDARLYRRTRAFAWSERNPWFFRGTAGEGIGGPHVGKDMIWPMSQIMYALTSESNVEIRGVLAILKASAAGTGFMHESYSRNDPSHFTRSWSAWANTLFGEMIAGLADAKPAMLASRLGRGRARDGQELRFEFTKYHSGSLGNRPSAVMMPAFDLTPSSTTTH